LAVLASSYANICSDAPQASSLEHLMALRAASAINILVSVMSRVARKQPFKMIPVLMAADDS
jgi:hypothetical protein